MFLLYYQQRKKIIKFGLWRSTVTIKMLLVVNKPTTENKIWNWGRFSAQQEFYSQSKNWRVNLSIKLILKLRNIGFLFEFSVHFKSIPKILACVVIGFVNNYCKWWLTRSTGMMLQTMTREWYLTMSQMLIWQKKRSWSTVIINSHGFRSKFEQLLAKIIY